MVGLPSGVAGFVPRGRWLQGAYSLFCSGAFAREARAAEHHG